ncbi:MAG: type II toxin-antitoxin system prevent-host-death family antitoxin [Treponema sp.]|nr:type II toxin-antitoxin system prevent-host-death family antitoxin [Treponema sp.]
MTTVPIFDVKNRLPYFIHLVESGETVQITRHGKPVARIVSEEDIVQEQKSEGQIFMEKLMDWRENANDWLSTTTNEEIDEIFNIKRTIEPDIRHPEDFE